TSIHEPCGIPLVDVTLSFGKQVSDAEYHSGTPALKAAATLASPMPPDAGVPGIDGRICDQSWESTPYGDSWRGAHHRGQRGAQARADRDGHRAAGQSALGASLPPGTHRLCPDPRIQLDSPAAIPHRLGRCAVSQSAAAGRTGLSSG